MEYCAPPFPKQQFLKYFFVRLLRINIRPIWREAKPRVTCRNLPPVQVSRAKTTHVINILWLSLFQAFGQWRATRRGAFAQRVAREKKGEGIGERRRKFSCPFSPIPSSRSRAASLSERLEQAILTSLVREMNERNYTRSWLIMSWIQRLRSLITR